MNLLWTTTVVIAVSVVVACAVCSAVSEYFSSKAHRYFLSTEKKRAVWEFKQFKSEEMKKVIDLIFS